MEPRHLDCRRGDIYRGSSHNIRIGGAISRNLTVYFKDRIL